jgi:flavodoxin
MKASIIFNSKHGKTKKYAQDIGAKLNEKGIENEVSSISDYKEDSLKSADIVFLGCWTGGLMIFGQHPEKVWTDFAAKIPDLKGKKLVLFTTYLLATGSMFRKMQKALGVNADQAQLILKSKSDKLSQANLDQLEAFLN